MEEAIEGVLTACRETGKIPGIYAAGVGKRRLDQGFLFVTVCNDEMLIVDGVKRILESLGSYRG